MPEELQNQYRYTPGQHLTLKALVNGEELRRCYSICSSPQEGLLQIGVKAIDQGRFSGFVNRMLKVGDALEVMVPQGRFGYQPQAERRGNYLAIAAGSGITPMLSIIKATLQLEPGSSFTLIYGNRNSRSMMFKEALSDLKTATHSVFSRCTCSARRVSTARCSAAASTANAWRRSAARCWISATMTTPSSAGRNR